MATRWPLSKTISTFLRSVKTSRAHAATQVEQEIARQMDIVLTARREVEVAGRLLDKQRRLERLRVDRVEQARADEWFLTRLSRRRREHFD